MLVLAATYMSGLSELVNRDVLERLLQRTIRFLLQSRFISPSLRADARILMEVYNKIFGDPMALPEDGTQIMCGGEDVPGPAHHRHPTSVTATVLAGRIPSFRSEP